MSSQSPLAAVGAVLRSANEHFHKVVVQGVVELALEAPFELRVVEVAGMQIEIVSVNRDTPVFELDNYLDAFAFSPGGESQKGMLVEAELGLDSIQARAGGFGHREDCKAGALSFPLC